MYSKHRLEMLSDAVFAIAMTLLILDLKVPADIAPGHLVAALLSTLVRRPEKLKFWLLLPRRLRKAK